MSQQQTIVIEGNEATTSVAYRASEVCVIYPITPSSAMGEYSDAWASQEKQNIWGAVPSVVEMQSEAGAAGALHGAAQTGTLTSTFTASQGLLLMIPNMYKISGELTPTVFHVASRSVATQAMSIFCDHSDVMATRATGFALLASASVQESHDMALIAHAATLKTRVPFLHFFDGFRTSHEIQKISYITDDQIRSMIDENDVIAHRNRRLTPEAPFMRDIVMNSDIFFQARESATPFYTATPDAVKDVMNQFAAITGRRYLPIEYFGAPDADRVIMLMGSGSETARETIDYLTNQGEKVGVVHVRLYRPFSAAHLLEQLPKTVTKIAVLDRVKEPGSSGEPLYQEVTTALMDAYVNGQLTSLPKVIGGRYGISGKEFTPAMVKAIFEELNQTTPKNSFTIGIDDDVSHSSLTYDTRFDIEPDNVKRAIFYGLGADGTVGANKSTIKIIGEETDFYVQAHFVYDSKKSGARTISFLRFGPDPIRSTYLISQANFIGVHQFNFVHKYDVLERVANGAIFLLNSHFSPEETWSKLPANVQQTIIEKNLKLFVIDAYKVAQENGMGTRINTIMQTCFFALSNILPKDEAIGKIKKSIEKTYAKKGPEVVAKNFSVVDQTLANLYEVEIPAEVTTGTATEMQSLIGDDAPTFLKEVIAPMMVDKGDTLKVSQLPVDGTYPTGTACYEKRNVSLVAPVWHPDDCIQCGQCSLVCPHTILRAKHYTKDHLDNAPASFSSANMKGNDLAYTIQVYPEDCTGCGLCVENCPANKKGNALSLELVADRVETARENIAFFESLPASDPKTFGDTTVKGVQFIQPLFEFCGACAGCGETPYAKLMTQLFGDRMLIATACGCSLVWGGNLPTNPWAKNAEGKGVAWSGSLFEDNAEFGYGFRLSEDQMRAYALQTVKELSNELGDTLVSEIQTLAANTTPDIRRQREVVSVLKSRLSTSNHPKAKSLLAVADYLIDHSIWAIGGDGWAYDIGYGGVDHVLASQRNINILVFDTEVYSNTGGQSSKSTPRGAVAKFASHGKPTAKKDLGRMAMTYGSAYVAAISLGANPKQAITAFHEAESYPGPSLILAYSHCIAHGIDMRQGMQQQKRAVQSGYWPLYRFDPRRTKEGLNPFQLDSGAPTLAFKDYAMEENRYRILMRSHPELAERLMAEAQADVDARWQQYLWMSEFTPKG